MKIFYILSLLVVLSSTAFSAGIHDVDTLYVDSIAEVKPYPANILGKPDNQFVTINATLPIIDVFFRRNVGGKLGTVVVNMKAGSTIIVNAKKDPLVDSSAGQAIFYYYDDAVGFQQSMQTFYLSDGETRITVPDAPITTWQYVEFSLPGAGLGTPEFATSFMIDAVTLLQDTDAFVSVAPSSPLAASGLQANYPNPFVEQTTISFNIEQTADVVLSIVGLNGVELRRTDLGLQTEGLHSEPIAISESGIYFIRMFANGLPLGSPLKVVAR